MSNLLCFVGLGNPGQQYKDHRHNIGAQLIENIAIYFNVELLLHAKTKCRSAVISVSGKKIHLVIPQSYMNESGYCIAQYLHFYKIQPTDLIVIHDELDFAAGQLRFKVSGGHGGHNGLRSIHQHLGTDQYKRIRVGIGHPGHKDKVADYVLNRPSLKDERLFEDLFNLVLKNWPLFVEESWDKVAMLFHKN
ncbi:aminoacyl-tRNA hydrolase [bacterium]|jgi:PTH1 family peptidyl-tRNA hydrolase|nr:aminoacyl-tRNA hydrolase [bacterium]NBW56178.1 aminoacyl-tRNA hydrolase [bacterium]NBX72255.1 aminoacyl-tRNA hydrolase [bacterium]